MTDQPLSMVVLVSGAGSNLQAILDAIDAGLPAQVAAVISNRPQALALTRAASRNIPTRVIDHRDFSHRDEFDARLDSLLDELNPQLVALAGFMRVLGDPLVRRWHGRMLNIHPSLLPDYRGLHTHRRVLEAGEQWHGCSVHYVTAELDGGPVVARARLEVQADDDEATLKSRVHHCEHALYPKVIDWVARGRLRLVQDTPVLDDKPLRQALTFDAPQLMEEAS